MSTPRKTHLYHLIPPTLRTTAQYIIPRQPSDPFDGHAIVNGHLELNQIANFDVFASSVQARGQGAVAKDVPERQHRGSRHGAPHEAVLDAEMCGGEHFDGADDDLARLAHVSGLEPCCESWESPGGHSCEAKGDDPGRRAMYAG